MYLLTSAGTFTSAQYDSIIESTKMAIDGLLNVFSALMPVYAILGAAIFGIALVLLLLHIIEGGCDMEKITAPLDSNPGSFYSWDSYKTKSYYKGNDDYFYDYDDPYKNRQRYWYLKHKYHDEIENDYYGDFGRWFNHKFNK